MFLALLGTIIISFFLGSIPWGVLIARFGYGIDIRAEGSGNIGTTNAMRSLGKKGGALVFLLDFGKGLLAGFIALTLGTNAVGEGLPHSFVQICVAAAFFSAIAGHIFSPWLSFKGGKGIAVAVGCLFVTFGPVGALIELALFGVIVVTTRYVSAGSVAAAVLCPFLSLYFFWGNIVAWILCTAGAILVIWAHRENIARLYAGTERRIGQSKTDA